VLRFRKAGEAVRRLRARGKGVPEIMAEFKLTDPAVVRRLEGVLDWLALAGHEPRAAALAGLGKHTFLAVVSRNILTVDDLASRVAELSLLPEFGHGELTEIHGILADTMWDGSLHQ
jgi:hypothetical protein